MLRAGLVWSFLFGCPLLPLAPFARRIEPVARARERHPIEDGLPVRGGKRRQLGAAPIEPAPRCHLAGPLADHRQRGRPTVRPGSAGPVRGREPLDGDEPGIMVPGAEAQAE